MANQNYFNTFCCNLNKPMMRLKVQQTILEQSAWFCENHFSLTKKK